MEMSLIPSRRSREEGRTVASHRQMERSGDGYSQHTTNQTHEKSKKEITRENMLEAYL